MTAKFTIRAGDTTHEQAVAATRKDNLWLQKSPFLRLRSAAAALHYARWSAPPLLASGRGRGLKSVREEELGYPQKRECHGKSRY